MLIRKANGAEQLKLWRQDENNAKPTARFFYNSISSGKAVLWTIDNEGELIGELYAFLDIDEDKDLADGKDTAYLCAFRIKKAFRGQGLGTMLMKSALSDLKERGFRYATIGADDEEHISMYEHMGFTEEIKVCFTDPCSRDENMQPETLEKGFQLLRKEL